MFVFFRLFFFFLFLSFLFFVHVFCSNTILRSTCVLVFLWNCTARHNSAVPVQAGLRYIIIEAWARASCVTRDVLFSVNKKKNSPLGPTARMQLWICGRGLESRQALQALLLFIFVCRFFPSFSFFFMRSPFVEYLVNLPHGFVCTKSVVYLDPG